MRRFVFVAHESPANGQWSLDDLPSSGGRIDVMCRNIQSAFHISHGIRKDVEVYCVFAKGGRTVRLQGNRITRLNPDERSTAARLQQALADPGAGPDWKEVQHGLAVADLDLEELLGELRGTVVLLDPDGTALGEATFPDDAIFVLSDHVPFTQSEYAMLANATRMSLGPEWYHGNHVVAVIHYTMDARASA